jgi:putative transposase
MSVNRGIAGSEAGNSVPTAGVPEAVCRDGENPPWGGAAASGEQPERVPLRELMDDRLLDAPLARSKDEASGLVLTGEGSMLGELVTAVLERALQGELSAHLGYGKHDRAGDGSGNSRNGYIAKTVSSLPDLR